MEQDAAGYKFFMRQEPVRRAEPEIKTDDQGRRYEMREIGMVRNAKSPKTMKVLLDPSPHVLIESGKPLQGWYQSKLDPGHRPRPCMTDAVLTEPYGGACVIRCGFAVVSGELVDTPTGPRSIETVRAGDLIFGRTSQGTIATRVEEVIQRRKQRYVRIELRDGRVLRITEEHPLYSRLRGWIRADIVMGGEELENLPMQVLQSEYTSQAKSLRCLHSNTLPYGGSPGSGFHREYVGLRKQRHSQVKANATADAGGVFTPGESGDRKTQVIGVETEVYRTSPRWGSRSPAKMEVQTARRTANWVPFGMGASCSPMVGLQEDGVGVRTGSVDLGSGSLSTGLLFEAEKSLRRSQGPVYQSDSRKDQTLSGGVFYRDLGSRSTQAEGHPVVQRVVSVEEETDVFDIQTETENYYVNGILVHNCYINSGTRGYRSQSVATVPIDYGDFVRKSISKMRSSAAGYFSSFTEPFQELETVYHNTQQGAEEFTRAGLPIFFLSRRPYPAWAFDLLKKNKYSYAQKSINTIDPTDWRKLSPGAIDLNDNFEEVRTLHKAGIYVSIQVNPIVAGVTSNEQIVELIHKLASVGADHLIFKFAEISYSSRASMVDIMTSQFGERGKKFKELFTCNIGHQATIDEGYRLDALSRFRKECKKAGVTMATCYEYKYERDKAGKILNKTGVSVGKEFLTGDQCHGHRVPMFTRAGLDEPFREIEECPPSGCLSCADDAEDGVTGKCGSKFMGSAPASVFADMKVGIYGDTRPPYRGPSPELIQIARKPLI